MKYFLLLIVCFQMAACSQRSKIVIYTAPEQEKRSDDFELLVNNKPVFVHQARVSRYPVNQVWPGYQRPIDQTEIAGFAFFDFQGEAEILIKSTREIKSLDVRPKEFGITPIVEGNSIKIKLSKPVQFTVEVNGYHHALHIFANPVENNEIYKQDPRVHYFGPGIHEAGIIDLKSDETVYIAGGAVVYGVIRSEHARNIKVLGRGILDASKMERGKAPAMISMKQVRNAYVSGIILRDSHFWAVIPTDCDSVIFDNIKLIGLWRYNSDGIDIVNCKNIDVRNSFIRAFDDNIVIRGTKGAFVPPYNIIEKIRVDSCVLWNDWGRAIEIGASTVADTIKDISFTNCYIPHFTAVAMDIQNCDRGFIKDIHFSNISIEGQISDSLTLGKIPIVSNAWGKTIVLGIYDSFYANDSVRGSISNISFDKIRFDNTNPYSIYPNQFDSSKVADDKTHFIRDNMYFGDIGYNCKNANTIYLSGYDGNHLVNNITVNDYFINGKKVTDVKVIGKNEFVRNVTLK